MELASPGQATDSVTRVAGNLNIGPNGASEAQVRRLIAQILDEREYQRAGENIFYGERLLVTDTNGSVPFGIPQPNPLALALIQPMLNMDTVRVFKYETALAHSMREPTFPAASAKFPQVPSHNNFAPLDFVAHIYTKLVMPLFNRAAISHYRGLADRRAAAVLLAIRLYEVDHGTTPMKLDQLVPKYLPAVPIDPFAPDGHVLRYVATPGAEAVYSVGENGRDDGGSVQLLRPANGRMPDPWQMLDAVFPLHPAPPLPPATEPAQ